MKIRVTLMTENDKHLPNKTKAELTAASHMAWEMICEFLNGLTPGEKATLEAVEVVEE